MTMIALSGKQVFFIYCLCYTPNYDNDIMSHVLLNYHSCYLVNIFRVCLIRASTRKHMLLPTKLFHWFNLIC